MPGSIPRGRPFRTSGNFSPLKTYLQTSRAVLPLRRTTNEVRFHCHRHGHGHLTSLARMPAAFGCFLLSYSLSWACGGSTRSHAGVGATYLDQAFAEENSRVPSVLHFLHSLYDPQGLRELIQAGGAPLVCTI